MDLMKQLPDIFMQSQITKASQNYLDNSKKEDTSTELEVIASQLLQVLGSPSLIETEGEKNGNIEAEKSDVQTMNAF
ncbi:hypothetical protein N7540_001885 [Penicillium herquei]|nr:hypothetical protein N7540_001885 [Penicillium herquei]